MPRQKGTKPTNNERIMAAWKNSDQVWPPDLGDKVRLFIPKSLRGKVAKVIAVGTEKLKASSRMAPKGKARVMLKSAGETYQLTVAQGQVFPRSITLKELQTT